MSEIRLALIMAVFGIGLTGCIVADGDWGRGNYHHGYYGGWHDDYYSRPVYSHPYWR